MRCDYYMTSKEKYRQLCKEDNSIPIFSKDWWMDAVCGEDNWDVLVVEKGGQIVASMPIYIKEKYGLKYITQPKLTQTNGIHIIYPENQKYEKRLSHEKKVMNEIIGQLEQLNLAYYQQNFHYSVTNWLPFYWKGFEQTTRYTYVIDDLSDLDKVFDNFSKSARNHIRKANKKLDVVESEDIEKFYTINQMTFNRQGVDPSYSIEYLQRIDYACRKNNCRKILFAMDKDGNINTAIYLIWDKNSAYLIMSGSNPKYRGNNAKLLLVWEAIKYLSEKVTKFDFEGSMIERIAEYNKNFGAVQKPYFTISKAFKYKPLFNIYKSLR
jgi:hypothetical protein